MDNKVKQLQEITQLSHTDCIAYLKKHKNNVQTVIDLFLSGKIKPSQSSINGKDILIMYNKYKDEKDEKIYSDGIEKLCEDLEISIEDKVLLVIAYESNAKQMGLFTKNEFIMAIQNINVKNINEFKGKLNTLRNKLNDKSYMKGLYGFMYDYSRYNEKGDQTPQLQSEMAEQIWKLLLNDYKINDQWITFISSRQKKFDITRDQWLMYLEFLITLKDELSNYNEYDAWPVLIDDFMTYHNKLSK